MSTSERRVRAEVEPLTTEQCAGLRNFMADCQAAAGGVVDWRKNAVDAGGQAFCDLISDKAPITGTEIGTSKPFKTLATERINTAAGAHGTTFTTAQVGWMMSYIYQLESQNTAQSIRMMTR